MVARALPTSRHRRLRQRRHGAVLQQPDRRALERSGWRTTLEFRENNLRGRDGRLLQVEEIWHAEAERDAHDGLDVVHASAEDVDEVWSRLRRQAELADLRRHEQHPETRSRRAS